MAIIDNILAKNDIAFFQMKMAKALVERRKQEGISREVFAKECGVSYGSLRRFEDSGEISLKNLLKIVRRFDELEILDEIFAKKKYTSMDELRKDRK
ncbi:MAG: transcriptional regulator [Bdellovibrio sp. CG12_big_fil_rev_8_21_14_0_65_39_13]|nr:MAG: transcriptional regulator [Bdellovibrio sp. CG22_combo_CG10-13_8_21_14_all_39_27]PIQ57676.1 MAG: transcriptional regulator [Bdellovibrio sp. CG12_big_fil_rev_8_21_14_0_65_39_13]PIR35188.1 MAG: transcriptional regulator [Bdellovibrio sp. CG11_big_fil_rev_8_21_14_0_20_39_38]